MDENRIFTMSNEEFLKCLENEFKDRFTKDDKQFRNHCENVNLEEIPIINKRSSNDNRYRNKNIARYRPYRSKPNRTNYYT